MVRLERQTAAPCDDPRPRRRRYTAETSKPKPPTRCEGTKQDLLIKKLQVPTGGTMEEIVAATVWQAHNAGGALFGRLGKKLELIVTSAKETGRGRVYRISQPAP